MTRIKKIKVAVGIVLIPLALFFYFGVSLKPSTKTITKINSSCLLSDTCNQVIPLSELSGKLIFFFSQYHCLPCVSQQLNKIKNAELHLHHENLVIINDFLSNKDLKIFQRNYNFKFATYKTSDRIIQNKDSKLTVPVFMVFDENLQIIELFHCNDPSGNSIVSFFEKYYKKEI
jgi:hypothetical protein